MYGQQIRYISNPALCRRWAIDRSTSHRYRKVGTLPAYDIVVNGRGKWKLGTIEALERKLSEEANPCEVVKS